MFESNNTFKFINSTKLFEEILIKIFYNSSFPFLNLVIKVLLCSVRPMRLYGAQCLLELSLYPGKRLLELYPHLWESNNALRRLSNRPRHIILILYFPLQVHLFIYLFIFYNMLYVLNILTFGSKGTLG